MKNEILKYVLHIDWDYPWHKNWVTFWRNTIVETLERLGFQVTRIIIKPSPSRKGGSHIWVHITSSIELTDSMINMLQWLLGDCQTRVWINQLRIDRGLKKFWNKLFTRHVWVRPLDEKCEKYRMRQVLNEMRKYPNKRGKRK